jgi:hypothetical protein
MVFPSLHTVRKVIPVYQVRSRSDPATDPVRVFTRQAESSDNPGQPGDAGPRGALRVKKYIR